MLTTLLSFSMWKRHFKHWYIKCVVTIPRQNLKSRNIIKTVISFFFILNHRSLDFKQLLEKEKPTLVDSSLDKPKALIKKRWFPTLLVSWEKNPFLRMTYTSLIEFLCSWSLKLDSYLQFGVLISQPEASLFWDMQL